MHPPLTLVCKLALPPAQAAGATLRAYMLCTASANAAACHYANSQVAREIVSPVCIQNQVHCSGKPAAPKQEQRRRQPRSKRQRQQANGRTFYQLWQFRALRAAKANAHKAIRAGGAVVRVLSAYSSQTCHWRWWSGQGEEKRFSAPRRLRVRVTSARRLQGVNPAGGWDSNAAKVIALAGAALVKQPRDLGLACQLQGYLKPLATASRKQAIADSFSCPFAV